MPLYPSTMLVAQFNTLFESVKVLQESMKELQATNSRMLSSIGHVRSLLQEEMQLDSTTFADADTVDATVEIATNSAAIVSLRRHSDLVEEDSSSEDNSEEFSAVLDNPIEPSRKNLHWSPPFIVAGETSPLEFCNRVEAFADQVFDGNSQRSNTESFLQSIINLCYGHQFAMYHCRWLDTGQKTSLMTLTGAVQSWLKCLGNEPGIIGVFIAALSSSVEAGQSNLVDQMFDEMPHYRSKVFDPGPSVIILAAMEHYLADGHSKDDHLFDECPPLVESGILSELHSIKKLEQDSSVEIGSIGSAVAFQENFTKQLLCDGDCRGKVQVAPRFTQLQVKLSPFDFSEIFASIEPIIPHSLEITALWIHAYNWIDTGQRLATDFIHVSTHFGPSLRSIILNAFDIGRYVCVSEEHKLPFPGEELSSSVLLKLTLVAHTLFETSAKKAFTDLYVSIGATECLVYIAPSLNLCAVAKFFPYFQLKYISMFLLRETHQNQLSYVVHISGPCQFLHYIDNTLFFIVVDWKAIIVRAKTFNTYGSVLDPLRRRFHCCLTSSEFRFSRIDNYLRVPEDGMAKQELIGSHSWFEDVPAILHFATVPVTERLIGAAAKHHASLTIAYIIFYVLVSGVDGLNITSIISDAAAAISYGLTNDASNIDFTNRMVNCFELDFKSKLRNDFTSTPIVLGSTRTACEGTSSLVSIAKCLAGYQPYDITFVSVISSMYSTSRCFNVTGRNFEEVVEADIIFFIPMISVYGIFDIYTELVPASFVATLDCIRDIIVNATRFEIVPRFHLVESSFVRKQFLPNAMMFIVGVRIANKPIVVVGSSSSRKSHVVSLRERLCVPTKWQVFLCILNIRTFQVSWLRNQIGLVTQDLALISPILLENKLYGMPDAAMEHFGLATMDWETTTHVVLNSNLEDKVLIEGGRIVTNLTNTEGPFTKMSNYIWDPGKMPIYRRGT